MQTLVGFGHTEDGHHHDDNCLKRYYCCENGHDWIESLRRTCKTEGCEWKGKTDCACHKNPKVDTWTDPEDYHVWHGKL